MKHSPLTFRSWQPEDILTPGTIFKVLEPKHDKPILDPDVLLVPLVGFNEDCRRLGYGGGYYDRTLEYLMNKKQILTIGVAFEC